MIQQGFKDVRWGGRRAVCSLVDVMCFQSIDKLVLRFSFVILILAKPLYICFDLPIHMQMYV